MKQTFFILLVFNVVSTFGKENNKVPFEEFYLDEGYEMTKRCTIPIPIIEVHSIIFPSGLRNSASDSS